MLERAFQSGDTLREGYYLDTEAELQLVDKVKSELRAAKSGSSEQLEKSAMKELGLKRSIHVMHNSCSAKSKNNKRINGICNGNIHIRNCILVFLCDFRNSCSNSKG